MQRSMRMTTGALAIALAGLWMIDCGGTSGARSGVDASASGGEDGSTSSPDGQQSSVSSGDSSVRGPAGSVCTNTDDCEATLSCVSGTCQQVIGGETGKPCGKNSECTSGICLPVGEGRNVCTTACDSQSTCGPGWTCAALIGQPSNVCQCTAAAESCNQKDDDCDGIVDNASAKSSLCGANQVCGNGVCSCILQCGSSCVDPLTDDDNCGTCGNACAVGAACEQGVCSCTTPGGTVCNGRCVDKETDETNCGACGATCASGASCGQGTCSCDVTGQMVCNGQCLDTQTDGKNCGTCGTTCGTAQGEICFSGVCANHSWANWPMPNPASTGLPNPASYSVTADVVTDNVTGLRWQRAVPNQTFPDWAAGVRYCNGLVLAGQSDWRLPTMIELYSLIDFTRSNPAIDTAAFPSTPADYYWSSSPLAGCSGECTIEFYWGMRFAVPGVARVRCVR